MAVRRPTYSEREYTNPAVLDIEGRFLTVNTTDPVTLVGEGFTVTRSAEGKWSINLVDEFGAAISYPELLCATGSAMLATAAADAGDLTVHFDPVAANTALSAVVVYLSQDGTDADTPAAWVNFRLSFRTTDQDV